MPFRTEANGTFAEIARGSLARQDAYAAAHPEAEDEPPRPLRADADFEREVIERAGRIMAAERRDNIFPKAGVDPLFYVRDEPPEIRERRAAYAKAATREKLVPDSRGHP